MIDFLFYFAVVALLVATAFHYGIKLNNDETEALYGIRPYSPKTSLIMMTILPLIYMITYGFYSLGS